MIACPRCGAAQPRGRGGTCVACADARDRSFRLVRQYLYENSSATVDDIRRATGVSEVDVVELMHEGRLAAKPRGPRWGACSCGQPALDRFDGRCTDCHARLAARFAALPADVREELRRWAG